MTFHSRRIPFVIAVSILSCVASNVQAEVRMTLRRGNLTITGDSANNSIDVVVSEAFVSVEAGEDDAAFPIADVSRIVVNSRQGDDQVMFTAVELPGGVAAAAAAGSIDISVNTSSGDDTIDVVGGWGGLSIVSGSGNDSICVISAAFSGRTRIRGGSGDDSVTIGVTFGEMEPDVIFNDDVNIGLGGGNDNIFVSAAVFGSNAVRLSGNAGEDCYFYLDNDLNLESIAASMEAECLGDG